MNELDFYNNLKNIILNSNPKDSANLATLEEVNKRLKQLQHKEQVNKWDNLCYLIENTTEEYEREHKDYVNVTIDYDDKVITITNNI